MIVFDPILRTRLSRFLTSDLLDDLPKPSALAQSSQRLSSLHKTLSSFLPQYIAENEARLTQDYGNLSPGTFMFADVSGFTALSERIKREAGPEGIEILTQVFNDYFSTMLEILAKSDGQLLKFAGDALLSFFPRTTQDELPKAIKTGLRMQRAMQERFQPIQNDDLEKLLGQHDLQLTMSIGVSRGKLFEALVGNIAQRDHIIMGRLPGEADEAEKAGVRDEVIISEALQAAYKDQFATKPLGDGFYQVIDNFGADLGDYEFSMPQRRRAMSSFLLGLDDEAALLKELEEQLARVEVVSRFVSSEIVNKLVVGGDHIESENRLATVIFVQFTGFAELVEAWGESNVQLVAALLSQYYTRMQRIITTHGGVLTRSDPYALGSKLLITFGAPVAHPDDAERAVETCLEMHQQLEAFNHRLKDDLPAEVQALYPFITQRMGITQGDVFAGEVGWRQRREYTVMGDDVNLAARLMSKASYGQTLIDERVWERINPYFETAEQAAFQVKGKSQPIRAFNVTSTRKSGVATTSDTPFIGRDVILLSLNMALQQAATATKKVQAIALHGDTGVGKTRLAQHFSIAARSAGFKTLWATCRSQSTRKTTWATLINQLLELDGSPDQQKAQLKEKLEALNLADLEEVFADLLFEAGEGKQTSGGRNRQRRASQATTNIYDRLSSAQTLAGKNQLSEFRQRLRAQATTLPSWSELAMRSSLADALLRILQAYSQQEKVLIVIDDLHKENQRALNILKRLLNELSGVRVMFLLTYEPAQEPQLEVHKIAVADLPEAQTLLMASAILQNTLGQQLSHFIWQSTSGRALYVESLTQALQDDAQLVEKQGVVELRSAASAATLPGNVRGLVISRVDRLAPELRTLLRSAAVLEDNFSEQELLFMSDLEDELDKKMVIELVRLQLLERGADDSYRFKHGVTQHALYEELTRHQRQKLHEKFADYLAQSADPDQSVMLRAYHLQKAGKLRQAADAMLEAAERAEVRQSYDHAAELYNKALEVFPDDPIIHERLERLQRS